MEDGSEEQMLAAAAVQPRKLSRLRKAGTTPKVEPPKSPFDQNVEPNERLPTPQASPSRSAQGQGEERAAEEAPASVSQQASEGQGAREAEGGEGYWDEEDELDEYYGKGGEAQGAAGSRPASDDEEEAQPRPSGSGGGSEDEEGSLGFGDIDADTQRILRDTAARDRLGKSSAEVQVKPISSILDKIKQRQLAAIERAAKPNLSNAPCFEEVFAAVNRGKASAAPTSTAAPPAPGPAQPAAADHSGPAEPLQEQPASLPATQAVSEPGQQHEEGQQDGAAAAGGAAATAAPGEAGAASEGEDDLEIMSDGEEEGANIVELPSSSKKARPSAFTQWAAQDVQFSYEDEVLIDDGCNSQEGDEAEEDDEGEEGGSEGEASEPVGSEAEEAGSDEQEGASSDGEQESGEGGSGSGQEEGSPGAAAAQEEEADRDEAEAAVGSPASADNEMASAGEPAGDNVAGSKKPRREPMQRLFLDMEAELSEEEGGQQSDDEEDDLDYHGELADLIGTAKETKEGARKREELHRQWAEQRDAKELQQVLRGLKQGFRRRGRGGFMDDEDDEEGGRRRRARLDGEEDEEGMAIDGAGGLSGWLADAGSDEDADDLDLLKRAQQRQALGESQEELERPSSVPLDENSQEVLSLLARSASEPQALTLPQKSRFAPPGLSLLGSEPSGAGGAGRLARGTSFVGRQPTVQRLHSGSMAGIGSRSFVFGREDSNSALPDRAGSGGENPAAGPTSFANLQQLTGMGSQGSRGSGKPGGSGSLVSRLAVPKPKLGSQGAELTAAHIDTVFQQIGKTAKK